MGVSSEMHFHLERISQLCRLSFGGIVSTGNASFCKCPASNSKKHLPRQVERLKAGHASSKSLLRALPGLSTSVGPSQTSDGPCGGFRGSGQVPLDIPEVSARSLTRNVAQLRVQAQQAGRGWVSRQGSSVGRRREVCDFGGCSEDGLDSGYWEVCVCVFSMRACKMLSLSIERKATVVLCNPATKSISWVKLGLPY